MYMNKTLILDLKNMEKVRPFIVGWSIAQWENPHISCSIHFEDDYGEINIDNKISENQLKMLLTEANIPFKDICVYYHIENLDVGISHIANTFAILKRLQLIDIMYIAISGTDIDIKVPFSNSELVEKVFKEFQNID